jgi:hypothetical protein
MNGIGNEFGRREGRKGEVKDERTKEVVHS